MPMALGTVSFTLGGADRVTFAVYSADDSSLNFYKRMDIPEVGDTFEGKTVTDIYTGFENQVYYLHANSTGYKYPAGAWYKYHSNIKTVSVIDGGIQPTHMDGWFSFLTNCSKFNGFDKIDYSKCVSLSYLFYACTSLTEFKLENIALPSCNLFGGMFESCTSLRIADLSGWRLNKHDDIHLWFLFAQCTSLASIDLSGWDTSRVNNFSHAFYECTSLETLDISSFSSHTGGAILDNMLETCVKLRVIKVGIEWIWANKVFPTPSNSRIPGADGKWYAASDGMGYIPADVPSGKADTYYAVAPSTFAVFSADDGSLDFYHRAGKPVVGDIWQGKSVDGVYVGFETTSYNYDNSIPITDGLANTCSSPWYSVKDSIKQVSVIDSGIKASSLRCWFANMLNVETVDISKLELAAPIDCTWTFINCRKMTSAFLPDWLTPSLISDLFYACMKLTSDGLSMPNFDMSSCTRSFAAFLSCYSLTTIPGIENWNVHNVEDFRDMFANCENLTADLSLWDVSSSSSGLDLPRNFNPDAPGVILPKPWQPTAFAVFSADDGSLDFYKREYSKMPKVGDKFEGKTVTEVYTGFETREFGLTHYDLESNNWDTCDTDVPWYEIRTRVTKVTVVDLGIKPHSLAQYFRRFENLESADLGNFDLSKTVSLYGLFLLCSSLRSANVPSISSVCTNFQDAFAYCPELKDLDFKGCDFSGANNFFHMFLKSGSLSFDCSSWNVWSDVLHTDFNAGAPGVIAPTVWTAK